MKKLFGFVMVGSNDLNKSAKFYDAVFVPLDIKKIKTTEKYIQPVRLHKFHVSNET